MKKKLQLNSLKVESFITALTPEEIRQAKGGDEYEGGTTTIGTRPISNTLCICVTRSNGCITYLSTCIPTKFDGCKLGLD